MLQTAVFVVICLIDPGPVVIEELANQPLERCVEVVVEYPEPEEIPWAPHLDVS